MFLNLHSYFYLINHIFSVFLGNLGVRLVKDSICIFVLKSIVLVVLMPKKGSKVDTLVSKSIVIRALQDLEVAYTLVILEKNYDKNQVLWDVQLLLQ